MQTITGARKELKAEIAGLVEDKLNALLSRRSVVVLGLCGGKSVSGIYERFKKIKVEWKRVHIFLIDERVGDSSNLKLIKESFVDYLVDKGIIPKENVHKFIFSGYDKIDGDLKRYNGILEKLGGRFNVVIASSGEDGHVASLFPKHETVKSKVAGYIYTDNSPKPPKERITASRSLLLKTGTAIGLFFGEEKREAYEKLFYQNVSDIDLPIKIIGEISDSYIFSDLEEKEV